MGSDFIQWVIIHYCYYLFWCSDCPRLGRWEPLQAGFCAYHSSGTRWSRLTLLAPALDSAILLKTSGSFQWAMILKPEIWELSVLVLLRMSLLMPLPCTDWRKQPCHITVAFHRFVLVAPFSHHEKLWFPPKSIDTEQAKYRETHR